MEKSYVYFATHSHRLTQEKRATIEQIAQSYLEAFRKLGSAYEEKGQKEYLNAKQYLKEVKIGETTDLKKRGYQLDCVIVLDVEWEGTKSDRLFVEAYIRKKIENKYKKNAIHYGNDHFTCANSNIIKSIANNFRQWALEGIELSKKI